MTTRTRTALIYIGTAALFVLPLVAGAQAPATQTAKFVSLTQLPGLGDLSSSPSIPAFLNQLYRILIGVAAAAAVIQIIRAGIELMTSQGSFMQNKKAKDHISSAVLGLVLVLSPWLILGVINPQIRNITLNFGGLKGNTAPPVTNPAGANGVVAPPSYIPNTIGSTTPKVNAGCKQIANNQRIDNPDQDIQGQNEACCKYQETATLDCNPTWENALSSNAAEYCECVKKGG